MTKRKAMGILLASLCAFIASSLWYSPALFGSQFLVLSGITASPAPDSSKIAAELLRNLLLSSVICWLLARYPAGNLKGALGFAGVLWLGFPFTLLSGSVLWQNVPIELGLIHCGDWLIKLLLMTATLWLVNRKAPVLGRLPVIGAVQSN